MGSQKPSNIANRGRKLKKSRKGHRPYIKPMNSIVDNDSPWVNPVRRKQENNMQIWMEHVNNIVSMIKINHKLDQKKVAYSKRY